MCDDLCVSGPTLKCNNPPPGGCFTEQHASCNPATGTCQYPQLPVGTECLHGRGTCNANGKCITSKCSFSICNLIFYFKNKWFVYLFMIYDLLNDIVGLEKV